ncbi:hypothetical protein BJ912DRAFT_923332 [Pholiota molesta]|nr:hypothetical protein BJ912DRAFT_923332 [Pholiota molesta]
MPETTHATPQTAPHVPGGNDDQEMGDATRAHPPPPPPLPSTTGGDQTALNGIPAGLTFHKTTSSPMKKSYKRKGGQDDAARAPIGTPVGKPNPSSSQPPPLPASAPNPALAVAPTEPLLDTPTPKSRADHGTAKSIHAPQRAPDLFNDAAANTSAAERERQEARARTCREMGSTNPGWLCTPRQSQYHPHPPRNVDAESLALWDDLEEADYCLAYLAFDAPMADKAMNAQKVKDLIKQIFDCPRLIVSSPGSRAASREDRKPILPYLITGLDRELVDILVERACWSAPSLTLFTFPSTYFLTNFVMTLRGFSFFDPERAHEAAATQVGRVLKSNPAVRKVVLTFSDNYPGYTADEVLAAIADTIEARELPTAAEGTTVTDFNIYMSTPTMDYQGFRAWLTAVRAATYITIEG